MLIRKASESDAEAAFSLVKEDGADSFSTDDFRGAAVHKNAIFLVAEEDSIVGYIIGFICPTKGSDCMLAETRVKKLHRRQGIGNKLADVFCEEAFRMGATHVFAEVDEKDTEFYSKNGFSKSNKWIEMVKKKLSASHNI